TAGDGFCYIENIITMDLMPYFDQANVLAAAESPFLGGDDPVGFYEWYCNVSDTDVEKAVLEMCICPAATNGPYNFVLLWSSEGDDVNAPEAANFAAMHYSFSQGSVGDWCIDFTDDDENDLPG